MAEKFKDANDVIRRFLNDYDAGRLKKKQSILPYIVLVIAIAALVISIIGLVWE